jgi:hypothetical protein
MIATRGSAKMSGMSGNRQADAGWIDAATDFFAGKQDPAG